ncbi:hypothetical protein GGF42_002891 [Coemansia sp. RSA 2424]|nr:hypothetical protein GGF42_002891 [Coemansia sp. RSA 2424]
MVLTSIKSSLPDIVVQHPDLPAFFFSRVRQNASFAPTQPQPLRPLYIDGDNPSVTLTLDAAEAMTTRLASGLYHAAGVRPGHVVAIAMPNSVHYLPIVLAVLTLGATCTLANPAYTPRELSHQLSDSQARLVITVAALRPTVAEATAMLEAECDVPIFLADNSNGDGYISVFDLLSDQDFPHPYIAPSATAFIPYSSGTTGLPKGVKLSHFNVIANILQITAVHQTTTTSSITSYHPTSIAVLPMFHSFGLVFLCFVMPIAGITTVLPRKFEMSQFLRLVKKYNVTETMLVPPIVNALAKLPPKTLADCLESLRWIVVGAAPLSSDSIATLESRLPGLLILQGYGLTETSPAISLNPPAARNSASVGRLLPNIEAKVIDDEGRTLGGECQVGELCFRGPNIMLGYLNNDEATGQAIDEQGFLHTGDVGYIDMLQHVYVTDRKKDLIKFNGFQVAPAELEGILLQHPSIRDCAVAGVFDHKRQTEVPRAYLVLTSPAELATGDLDAQQAVDWVNGQVAYYKQLRGGFVIVNAIPRNASGKILRRLLE